MLRTRIVALLMLCLVAIAAPMASAQAPATRPQRGGLQFLQRIRTALDQLDLSPDQHSRVADLVLRLQNQMQGIRRQIATQPALRDQAATMLEDFREQLLVILTPDQQQKLRELMQQQPPTTLPSRPARRPQNIQARTNESSSDAPTRATVVSAPTTLPASAAVGADAPPFLVRAPGGTPITLSSFKGHVLVLEFGSLSAPTFRDHVAAMERLAARYSYRASFLVIYTREAHPAGDNWESDRNATEGIAVDQPATMADRIDRAENAAHQLNITLTVAADSMDDAATTAYGGFPNATVVIGKEGRIIYRQQWTDPSGLPRVLDAALAN